MIADDFRKPTLKPVEIKFPDAPERMPIFLANRDNPYIVSAVEKLARCHGPGSVVMLTADEFDAITDPEEFRVLIPT